MYSQYACSTESRTENAAFWLAHKAKVQLLNERIKARIEALHGKELDALADSLVSYAKDAAHESSAAEEKVEKLQEQFDKLFG